MMHSHGLSLVLVLLWILRTVATADLYEQVWASVIFTTYGDRTPYIFPETYTLTPLGAQQLYSAGSAFRNRYVIASPSSASQPTDAIVGIEPFQLNVDQVTILSTTDQFIMAGAQAFMQGLYPPAESAGNVTIVDDSSLLANGTAVVSPLNGYQYPQIYTVSETDDDFVWIAGKVSCPTYDSAVTEYWNSDTYTAIQAETAGFYASLQPDFLNGIFPSESVGYFDAYFIYDYLQYGMLHNATIANHLSEEDFLRAKILAADLVFAQNSNVSETGSGAAQDILTISGRTLATKVIESLYTNVNTAGDLGKLTLLFGSFEPMVAFASLVGLASPQSEQFYSIPASGASMVFELFSWASETSSGYPDSSNLNVRFFYSNGTGPDADLVSYPLFGGSPSQNVMTLEDFVTEMESIWMPTVADWCNECGSFSIFCPAFANGSTSPGSGYGSGTSSHGVSASVAGIIGAIVTLVVIGTIAGILMLAAGFRVHRIRRNSRSDLGGFKGGEKLASDQDLTALNGGTGASVVDTGTRRTVLHERVGSWEMGDRARAKETQLPNLGDSNSAVRKPSFEDDDIHVHPSGVPVKLDDRV